MSYNKSERGMYAPQYYRDFHCIADRCRHSCCIGWEIDIDGDTYEKYKSMPEILPTVALLEDGPCFALGKDGRCPHLDENGLCKIILSHGEDCLSEICRHHPRFYNAVSGARIEAGYGIACEEACRLILTDDRPFSLSKVEELADEDELVPDFDALPFRDHILSRIGAMNGFDALSDALKRDFRIPTPHKTDEWIDFLLSLEILEPDWGQHLQALHTQAPCDPAYAGAFDLYYARLLTYFVYRHVSMSRDEDDLRARLGFCLFSVEMLRALLACEPEPTLEDLAELARRYSAEIEYSEDNTAALIDEFARALTKNS